MFKPTEVKALSKYQIWVRYQDGNEGIVDLSELSGQGVFKVWDDGDCFFKVHISETGAVAWGESLDICPDAIYLKITGKKPEELFPKIEHCYA